MPQLPATPALPRPTPCPVVDTHCHAGLRQYEPVESLVDQLFRHGVGQAVLVQHGGEYDNRYLAECCQRFAGRFVAAILVDVGQPDAPDQLTEWARRAGVRGLRLRCSDPEPVWRRSNELGLIASLSGQAADLASPEVRRLVARYDRITYCVEHLGLPDPAEPEPRPTYRRMLRLGELSHVYLKVSGFYAFSRQRKHPYTDVAEFGRLALEAFGPGRMMWGSDFPPVSAHEGYGNALAFVDVLYPGLSADERARLLGGTAREVWGLESR